MRPASAPAGQPPARASILVGLAVFGFALFGAACGGGQGGPAYVAPVCAAGESACGQRCLDLASDPANCGGCGIPCGVGQICQAGACECTSGVLCNGACVAADANACADGRPSMVVTSAPGAYWNLDGVPTEVTSGSADVVVDEEAPAQVWEGFGGAFNEMGWNVLSLLSEADRDKALQLLFGADGARFAFGRIPIGASDYAMDRYTLDETPGDTTLASFSIDRDQQKLIPFVKAAQAIKPALRFWASPWTPPTWMKDPPYSPGQVVSPFDGGTMKDDDATMSAFAGYLTRFVAAYAEQGITVEAISPQNEPNYTGNYPTCGWSPATYAKFVGQYLGPAVAAAGVGTKIVLGTFNGGGSDPSIVDTVMGDAYAGSAISVLGFQWGMLAQVGRDRAYALPIWQTEHKCGNYPWLKPFDPDAAPNDQAYAVESWGLIRDWIRAGVTAYSAWNMVLDTVGVGIDTTRTWPQDALLTVDTAARTLNVTPAFYVFRHVSEFVTPGARVLATHGDALGFKNPDGSLVAVVFNAGAAKTMTVAVGSRHFQLGAPGNGWATIVVAP